MNAPIDQRALDIYNRLPTASNYFQISVKLTKGQPGYLGMFSVWVGRQGRYEMRAADLVIPEAVYEDFRQRFDQNIAVINDLADLKAFAALGGHALISEEVVHDHWPELAEPRIAVWTGRADSYINYQDLASKYLQRFPRGEFRMQILTRDGYRCRVCGKHADDHIDVRLEVDHIQPWSEGGLTHEGNLITLCLGCHEGAKGIDRDFLFAKVNVNLPDLGPKFFEPEKMSRIGQIKLDYYLNNLVTMKLPKLKR